MYILEIRRIDACEGRFQGYEYLYFRSKENAEKRAEKERKNHFTCGGTEIHELHTED